MGALNRPIEHWGDWFVFHTIEKLDSETVKLWQQNLRPIKKAPTWKQLVDFLWTRRIALKGFEKMKPSNSSLESFSKFKKSKPMKSFHSGKSTMSNFNCCLCSASHYISNCPEYHDKSIQQKLEIIKRKKLCYNCLGQHNSSSCHSTRHCFKCGNKHHSSIHRNNSNSELKNNSSTIVKNSKPTSKVQVNHVSHNEDDIVLLPTAQVLIKSLYGENLQVRAMIDQGSQISLITEKLVQQLRLPRTKASSYINGIGDERSKRTKGIVNFNISSHFDSKEELNVTAYILSKLTGTLPSDKLSLSSWPHLQGLNFADPTFNTLGQVDIMLGADMFGQIIENGLIKGSMNSPIAQNSKLGWIVSGPSGLSPVPRASYSFHVSVDLDLHTLVKKFWELDDVPLTSLTSFMTKEEQECESHFQSTHSRDNNGRYIVRLPLKSSSDQLGDSYSTAVKILQRLNNKFQINSTYHQVYNKFIEEYKNLHHMEPSLTASKISRTYYLPHHGVLRETSLTTKLRVVVNASSKTSTGISLNDILHAGPKLQTDLFDVLIWFRQFRYVFSADMEKMYRQIKVHPDDWGLQRILWTDEKQGIIPFQLTTVTYGLACAPYLTLRTVQQLIQDEGDKFPLAMPSLTKGRYVDDVFGGADTIQQAKEQILQINHLCMAGGFSLQKWISNCNEIVNSTPLEKKLTALLDNVDENLIVHSLVLNWKPSSDSFHFNINTSVSNSITKRTVLSTIAKIFDPLGLLSPITIIAKIFI